MDFCNVLLVIIVHLERSHARVKILFSFPAAFVCLETVGLSFNLVFQMHVVFLHKTRCQQFKSFFFFKVSCI